MVLMAHALREQGLSAFHRPDYFTANLTKSQALFEIFPYLFSLKFRKNHGYVHKYPQKTTHLFLLCGRTENLRFSQGFHRPVEQCSFLSSRARSPQRYTLHHKKAPLSGRPHQLAAAAAVAVALAAVPGVAVAAAVAEDQQEDDDPPPVVAAEAPADPIVVSTHNRYLQLFCWASLPTLHVMTGALFCAPPPLAG